MRRNLVVLLPLLLLLPALVGQNKKAKDEGWSDLLPPGEGRELVLNSCTSCHNLRVVVHARLTRAAWTKSVNDMIQRGAPLFTEEIEPITGYLSTVFGPAVPKLLNVNTAGREDLEKLPNLNADIVTRILEARGKAGPFKNSEELRRALGMEKGDFAKDFYLLKYSN